MRDGHEIHYDYVIDSNDRLTDVNQACLTFAGDNGGDDSRRNLIGRELFEFIAGIEARAIYRMLIDRVRSDLTPVTVPFRCDSPEARRFMELEIRPADESIYFTSRLVREEPRPAAALLLPDLPRSDATVTICSWCKKVAAVDEWVEVEEAIHRLDLLEDEKLPQLTHGMCAQCQQDFGVKS